MTNTISNTLIDILLPPICISCKKEGDFLCKNCMENINLYKYFVCPICKKRSYDGILEKRCASKSNIKKFLGAPLPYNDPTTQKLIHTLKYKHVKELARPLSQILINFLERNHFSDFLYNKDKQKIIISPIPLYDFRERERGFNQSYEIAKYIGEYYKIPVEKLLRKHKNTPQQADIKQKEKRLQNLHEAFSLIDQTLIKGKVVILIDDVYTTGATMSECAYTLRKASAKEIWGMTIARG